MEKFAFVILNYESKEETSRCIESIRALNYKDKYIVVVDNNSSDSALLFTELKKRYADMNNIVYLQSGKNLGYARGNNIGIDYARNVLKADYVCVINPDAVVESNNFIEKCIELYKKQGYAVLGPRVMAGGVDKNPLNGYNESVLRCIRGYVRDKKIVVVKKYNLKRFNIFQKSKRALKRNYKKEQRNIFNDNSNNSKTYEFNKEMGVVLCGCCLVFSPLFLKNFSGFCRETFLYCEEYILACVCYNLGYKMLYSKELCVSHEGGKSMENIDGDADRRRMRMSQAGSHSTMVCAKVYMHKRDKRYLKKCLNPEIDEYMVCN